LKCKYIAQGGVDLVFYYTSYVYAIIIGMGLGIFGWFARKPLTTANTKKLGRLQGFVFYSPAAMFYVSSIYLSKQPFDLRHILSIMVIISETFSLSQN
jgi:hypothetical protein